MNTPIENPQGCPHHWEDATTLADRRRARRCLLCGRIEHFGTILSDGERREIMAEAALLRANKMAGLPGYYQDE